ncbi:hypothetical protein [Mesorhizobium hawassense]|uniref:hypothetical protein n=1 Tax=Mesorhizobium hawassense TaxID=1209954 RepID=UPI0011BE52AF|nr:hypothetical protein [Mesorhizobium hawassense]
MQNSIKLALVLVLCGCTSCFAGSDLLRVSVDCPKPPASGNLVTVDEKPNGYESRITTSYVRGQVDKITVANSVDGSNFRDQFMLGRSTSTGTNEFPAFRAFEDRANELLRFFCLAEPAAKQRYLDLMQANRALLRQ